MESIAYILGSTRSGTSALRNALGLTRYSGYGEGHIVPVLNDIINAVRYHRTDGLGARQPGNGLFQMRENVLLRHLFHGYESYLVSQVGSNWVMDKTPTITPIMMAPELNTFHKKARFLHCARRHIDNVQSKLKKFPDRTLEQHCEEWAQCNLMWLQVRDRLGENFIAFDFYDLSQDPEGTIGKIGRYLALDEEETAQAAAYLTSQRPQAANASRDLTKYLSLSEIDWTDKEKETFIRICEPVGQRLGYGLEDYWASTETDATAK